MWAGAAGAVNRNLWGFIIYFESHEGLICGHKYPKKPKLFWAGAGTLSRVLPDLKGSGKALQHSSTNIPNIPLLASFPGQKGNLWSSPLRKGLGDDVGNRGS